MLLRPRQKTFVERSAQVLGEHGNTLAVASTGFGKTIALAGVTGQLLKGNDAKACILAHRDELTAQNEPNFLTLSPENSPDCPGPGAAKSRQNDKLDAITG